MSNWLQHASICRPERHDVFLAMFFWRRGRNDTTNSPTPVPHTLTKYHQDIIIEGSLNRNFRQYGELKSSSRVVKSVDKRCNSVKVK